jgi:mono/diheme cytochrome c family protein
MSRPGWMLLFAAIVSAFGGLVGWQREPLTASTVVSLDGAMLFHAKGCAACHDGPDSSALIGSGFPSLADASTWAVDRRPSLTAVEYLSESIREPWAFMSPKFSPGSSGPTNAMPALQVSEAEVSAIVEYLLAS